MSGSSSSSSSGIGVLGLLGVVFVTLKLTGFIDWSWWWVTAPFWGGFALALMIVVFGFRVYLWLTIDRTPNAPAEGQEEVNCNESK